METKKAYRASGLSTSEQNGLNLVYCASTLGPSGTRGALSVVRSKNYCVRECPFHSDLTA